VAETKLKQLQRWMSRIERAERRRKDWEITYRVKELERYWLGQQWESEGGDRLWLNHFFATIQTQQPTVLPKQAMFVVKPTPGRKVFGTLEAQTLEAVLRAIAAQEDNLFTDASLAVAQAFFRLGVLKVVYDPRFEPNPQGGEAITTSLGEDTGLQEPDELLTDEVYRWEWVDARRMLLPDEGPNIRKWSWIAEEIEMSLEEAKEEPRFRPGLRRQLVANAVVDEDSATTRSTDGPVRSEDDAETRFCYYECWDIRKKRLYCWAKGQQFEEFLYDEDFPAGIDDHPYAFLRYLPILGPEPSAWPLPPTYNWLPIQREYNILREQQVNAARRAARKFLYEPTTFRDEEQLDKFTSPADMQGVEVADIQRPPIMFGEVAQNIDVARNIPILRDDWRVITGATGTRLGNPDADTATEAVLTEQSAALRDTQMRLLVDKWLGMAGKKMLQLVKQTLTLEIYVQLRGFSDKEFKEFLQLPGIQNLLALQLGQQNVAPFLTALEANPLLQQRFRERYGTLKPLAVSRSQLQFEADVEVLPSAARPLQQTQLLRLASVLGPLAFGSPTFVEELLSSFDLANGARISEEILLSMRQMGEQMAMQPQGQPANARRTLRTGPRGLAGGTVGI